MQVFELGGTQKARLRVDTSDNVEISTGTGSGTTRFGIASNGDISFYNTGAAAKFFWDASAERLGVGTATPSYSLDVNGTGRFSDTLHLGSGTSNPGKLFISDNSATNYVMRIQGTGTRGYAIEGSSSGAAYNLTLANENVAEASTSPQMVVQPSTRMGTIGTSVLKAIPIVTHYS